MAELEIGPELVGRRVFNPARPEWGAGTVLRVQTTGAGAAARHRVSVQFAAGHKVLQIPPASLTPPRDEQPRQAGWLDTLAGDTVDDRLRRLPPAITSFLGTPAQRLAAVAELYQYTEEPRSLIDWARRQTGVADPLSHWSRDELLIAFGRYSAERDAELRMTAARVKQAAGQEGLHAALDALPAEVKRPVVEALRRPI